MSNANFAIKTQTLVIENILKNTEIGNIVDWSTLETATGLARISLYPLIRSAVRRLQRDQKMHFITRDGLGIERVSHGSVAQEVLPKQNKGIIKASRKVIKTISNLDLDQMSQPEKTKTILYGTVAKITEAVCSKESTKLLESKLEENKKVQPFEPKDAMLQLLAGRK